MSDASNRPAAPRMSLAGLATCPRCRSFVRSHRAGSEPICPFCDHAQGRDARTPAAAVSRNPVTWRMLSALGVTALATALGGCPDTAHDDGARDPASALAAPASASHSGPQQAPEGVGDSAAIAAPVPGVRSEGSGVDASTDADADEVPRGTENTDTALRTPAAADDVLQAAATDDDSPVTPAAADDEPRGVEAALRAPDDPAPIENTPEPESARAQLAIAAYGMPPEPFDPVMQAEDDAGPMRVDLIRCDATDANGSSADIEPDIARLQRTIQRWYEREWQAGRAPEGRTRVVVSFSIDENGRVFDEEVDGRGLAGSLAGATSADIRRWRFSPPDTAPVRVTAEFDLIFGGR